MSATLTPSGPSEPLNDLRDQPAVPGWSPLERFTFRFAFAYFAIFACASLLDVGPSLRAVVAWLSDTPVRWFGQFVLRLDGTPATRGPEWAAAQQIVAFIVAAIIAGVWSAVSRRSEYRRLRGWSLIVLRYYVAVIMLVYGGFKVIPSQFPPLSLEQLSRPLGALAPMGLLWTFMGYSTVYTTFTGLGETVGAFLLFFRRTTTLGALILTAVLSNVALLNYAYDVPVKQLSVNLLLASVVLAAADVKRLIDVFLLNRNAPPADQSFDYRRRWIYRVRRILKPLIIVAATIVPLGISFVVHHRMREKPPLFGLYDVDAFTRNGAAVPPSATDTSRWRQVMFGLGGTMAVRLMSDSLLTFIAAVDTNARGFTMRPRNGSSIARSFDYTPMVGGGLRLRGATTGDTLDLTLRRVDHETAFRLTRPRK